MITNHVPFEKLSDLLDNDCTSAEREDILRHLDFCPDCRQEYQRLKNTLEMCSDLASVRFDYSDLMRRIDRKARFRRISKLLLRVGPAAAASIILLFSFALYEGGHLNDGGASYSPQQVAEKEASAPSAPESSSDVEQVIGILRDNNATILNVSDMYVEGKISLSQFEKLRRDLGFRRVTYGIISEASPQVHGIMKSNIEEVVSQDGFGNGNFMYQKTGENYMRFKVFRP